MNPYSLTAVLHAKHAQHVVLVHFPIALFLVGVLLDAGAEWTRNASARIAARWDLILAALSTFPVLLTGVAAWRWALEGQRLKGLLLQHVVLASCAAALMWAVGWIHFRSREKPLPRYRLPLEFFAAALTGAAAHLGGFLSGVNLG